MMMTPTMYGYCTKEDDGLIERGLIVLALQGMKFMHVFFILYIFRKYASCNHPLKNIQTMG
jgi:hypothetical protein